jgi:hypothetical protein
MDPLIGNGEVDSSILSGSTTVRAKKSGFRRSQTPPPNRGADAHFYFASETLLDISLKRLDRIGFLRRQRRLPDGNLRRKNADRCAGSGAKIKASFRFD